MDKQAAYLQALTVAEALASVQSELADIRVWIELPDKAKSPRELLQTLDDCARRASLIVKELQRRNNIEHGVYA